MIRRTHHRRGAALILALITLIVCFTLGMAISALTMHNLHAAREIQSRTLAFNLAESGAEKAIRYLKTLGYPPSNTTPFQITSPVNLKQVSLAGGQYDITFIPDPNNPGFELKKFTIHARGTHGGYSETVDIIVRQQSFGKYAYFTDKEVSSVSGGAIWFYSGDKIRGPAHSNNRDNSGFKIDWTTSTGSIFDGQVTSAASSITYTPKTPSKEADFLKIFKTGSKGYQLDVDPIDLPSSTEVQKEAAWGSDTGFPTTKGVYANASGGIYIVGDSTVEAYVANGSDQGFKIVNNGVTWDVVVSPNGGFTKIKKGSGNWTTSYGTTNAVVYSAGNITSLKGEIADNTVANGSIASRNAFTICTDVVGGKNITITDNITYKTRYNPNEGITSANNMASGTLGLIGRNVVIDNNAPNNLNIDAIIMAGSSSTSDGSFYVNNYNSKAIAGQLKVTGGIIQKARGAVGTLSNGSLATGYAKDYYYDYRLADNPPPYFPTTGGYDRISWSRTGNVN